MMRMGVRLVLVVAVTAALGVALTNCGGGGGGGGRKPRIESVAPNQGSIAGGDTVTIVTANFKDDFLTTPPTSVLFGGVAGTGVGGTTADTVVADTPAGAAAGFVDVEVIAQNGQSATLALAFEYLSINCTVGSVAPGQGTSAGGTTVNIFGTDFEIDPATTVTFGGIQATGVTVVNDLQITCITPAYPTSVDVDVDVVVTSTSRSCTGTAAFRYIVNPTCTINSVFPTNGDITGGTTVQVSGSGFENFSTVTFGGVAGTGFVFIDPTLVQVDTPADPLGNPAGGYTVDVDVSTPGGANCSLPSGYTYNAAAVNCTITAITPNNGDQTGGTVVTIDGTNFGPMTPPFPEVLFGALAATVDPASTATQIICTTPAQPSPGAVTVVINNATGGTCQSINGYTYNPTGGNPCTISAITPSSGDVSGGDTVLIDGTNFDAGTTVFFGGIAGNVTGVTATQITVDTPPASGTGFVDVDVVPVGFAACVSTNGFQYTGCGITDISPPSGPVGGGNSVAVNGSGFNATDAEVAFDGVPGTVTSRSTTQILVTVPPGAAQGLVDVLVSSLIDGTACTLLNGYQYAGCTITSITPGTGDKVGGDSVTIVGTDFDPVGGAVVLFGTVWATNVVVVDATTMTCDTPPSIVQGPIDVMIICPGTAAICILQNAFSYNAPTGGSCTISSLTPPNGPEAGGTQVEIFGSGFEAPGRGPGVLFGPLQASSVTYVDQGHLIVTNPPGAAGPVNVSVVNDSGSDCTLAGGYTYEPVVVCTDFCDPLQPPVMTPTSGPQAGGTTITLSAPIPSFCLNAVVEVWQQDAGGNPFMTPATITSITAQNITATMPAAPAGIPGPATVNVTQVTGICGPFSYTYN